VIRTVILRTFALAVFVLFGPGSVGAVPRPAANAVALPVASLTPETLEPLFDHFFGPEGGLTYGGAVVTVVHNGRIILLKGYGHEDLAGRHPIDPRTSRFGVASVTKTFVATRVAQLLEAGRIRSLDDPANQYLTAFKLPDNRGHALTIRDLLTHQSGLADTNIPWGHGDRAARGDPEAFRKAFPGFIAPAQTGARYSNYGVSTLALMVEEMTGESIEKNLRDTIFGPAGLTQTFWPANAADRESMTQIAAYYPDGSVLPIPAMADDEVTSLGAGGLATTGADMARYMLAQLGGSPSLSVPPLVKDSTRKIMFSRLGQTTPLAQGYGTVFMLSNWNGTELVEHGGRDLARQSQLTLIPSMGLGIFVSFTGERGAPSGSDILGGLTGHPGRMAPRPGTPPPRLPSMFTVRASFLKALLGDLQPPIATPATAPGVNLSEYSGAYYTERRPLHSAKSVLGLFFLGEVATVTAAKDGTLSVNGRAGYHALARDVFWRTAVGDKGAGFNNLVQFRRGPDGRIQDMVYAFTDTVYEPISPWASPGVLAQLFGLSALVFLTGLLGLAWPTGAGPKLLALVTPGLIIGLPVVFFGCWPKGAPAPFNSLLVGQSELLAYQAWALAVALAALAFIPLAATSWRDGRSGIGAMFARLHLSLLAMAAAPLIWVLFRVGALPFS
jgi:CubicO group peptidase (beta-lactamase class C family)